MNDFKDPFWEDFYLPNDELTERYKVALEKLITLPASFYIYNNDESFGLPILDLKKPLIKPIKHIPLYSKLINKDYETETSKSDDKIAKDIRFFTNNLPSFLKYKDKDDLSWIIKQNRLLTTEIFEFYSKKPKISLTTIEGRFVAILRISRIAYDTKQYPLYQKISLIMITLRHDFLQDEENNELNE